MANHPLTVRPNGAPKLIYRTISIDEARRLFRRLLLVQKGYICIESSVKSGRILSYSASHAGNAGSNPAGITKEIKGLRLQPFFFF